MVPILDRYSEHVAHACRKIGRFGKEKILKCAPISKLPSNI